MAGGEVFAIAFILTEMIELITEQALITTVEVVVGALVGGFITLAVSKYKERKSLEQKLEELTSAVEANRREVSGDLKSVKEQLLRDIAELKEAESAALRNIIRHGCEKAIHNGYISLHQKSDLLNCYDKYEKIIRSTGMSNGVVEDIVSQMRELPNEKPIE